MKTKFFLLALMMLTASVSFAKRKHPPVNHKIISFKNNALYFKVDKSFIGGVAELFDSNNNLIESEGVTHTHTMIDFEDAPSGKYVIKVTKGNKTTEMIYITPDL